jgi:nucleotide-binding universal stress UspA family protein
VQQHILVPLDGSTFSEAILPHAVALAHATESALILLQILEPVYEPIYGTLGISEKQQEEQVAQMRDAQLASIGDYLLNIAKQLRAEGLEVHTEVIEGNDPAAYIVLRAEQDPHVLLIAMATHGRSRVLRWLFGSVTAEVVQLAPVPLLLLRPHENGGPGSTVTPKAIPYQTVIVPLDGSSFAEQALEQAHLLASAVSATLLLVSILPPPNDIAVQKDKETVSLMSTLLQLETERRTRYLEHLAEPLRKQGVVVHTHVATGHPAEEILRLSAQLQLALLVMTTHGRSGLQRLFLGSRALKVVQGAHGPILLVRGRPEEKRSRMDVR